MPLGQATEKASAIHVPMDNFNSTTKLADHGPADANNEKDDLYNPFDHRQVAKPTSDAGSLAHLLKSSLGTGILAMPMAFKNSGLLFGAIGTVLVGFLCTHCVHILVKESHNVCKKTKTPLLGFAETAGAVFANGPTARVRSMSEFARKFVDFSLMATYYSAIAVYIVFIGNSVQQVMNFFTHTEIDVRVYIGLSLIPLLLIGQIRELKFLVPFSALANLFIVISFSITLYYMFEEVPDISERELFSSWGQLPLFFSTVIFAMEGIGVVMPVENGMQKPHHFLGCPGVLNISMSVVMTLYAVMGFFGYLRYGDETQGSITLNLPVEELPAQIVKILITVAIIFTFGLQFYVPNDILWRKVEHRVPKNYHNIAQIGIRSGFILIAGALAAAVPDLEPFIGLVGAICFSTLGITVPAVVETVARWDGNLGFMKWVLWKNILLIVLSIFALVSGSVVSINQIIELYTKKTS